MSGRKEKQKSRRMPTGISTYEHAHTIRYDRKITAVKKVNGTWLIWFNGQEAYCCTHGAKGTPNGCPVYNYSHTSIVSC